MVEKKIKIFSTFHNSEALRFCLNMNFGCHHGEARIFWLILKLVYRLSRHTTENVSSFIRIHACAFTKEPQGTTSTTFSIRIWIMQERELIIQSSGPPKDEKCLKVIPWNCLQRTNNNFILPCRVIVQRSTKSHANNSGNNVTAEEMEMIP